MYKWIMSTFITVACALGVYLLATGLPDKPHDEAEGLKEGQELLKITASNFEFNEQEYHVKAGTPYVIKFSNKLGNHGAEIKDLGIELETSKPSIEYTFDKPGTYEMHCSIMCGQGHSTMISKIIVE